MKNLLLLFLIPFACGCGKTEQSQPKEYGFEITTKPVLLSDNWWAPGSYAPYGSPFFNYDLHPQAGFVVQLKDKNGIRVTYFCLEAEIQNRVRQLNQIIEQIKKVDSFNDSIVKIQDHK